MNKIANRQVVCDTLIELGKRNEEIVVLTSDSRGSASMTNFARELPAQFIEAGIAEQNLVGIAAGLAAAGKIPFVASPACFLSMRSIEQVKVDIAYSRTNVKLIGISGGVSYGALGMSHHSLQDLAVMRAIPGMVILLPADRFETGKAIRALADYPGGAYLRIGRNPVPDVYESEDYGFAIGKAVCLADGKDITLIGTGETVRVALESAVELRRLGITCRVLNMHTIKPLDEAAILQAARDTGRIITIEEHSIYGGLGAAVAEVVAQKYPVPLRIVGIADEPAIPGKSPEVFAHYGICVANIKELAKELLSLGA
ncbi:Hypothetical protein LUCI_4987 [Lucifera butyrica]|uniref:Transketolase-like pyrimidine-binding domain-containing protein n=1 Tax=Lucifera butyrica TaxID=1351585 RepID=A0A498RED4_9FIRM|nr:transketolase C-terminal domain-containing protein [Lucifera butyrica]VBB09689.1 Hypothetical protein LUCI_4987 [Lucifera butyrica]